MKGKATNEQLAKVLEYTLSEHQKNIEKSEKERNIFLKEFENQIETLKKISFKPNLTEFERLNEQLEKGAINGEERIKSALRSAYFSPFVLGIVAFVFIAGLGMMAYSFKKIEKANELADAKELALTKHFSRFLTDNPKANESYKVWKDKR